MSEAGDSLSARYPVSSQTQSSLLAGYLVDAGISHLDKSELRNEIMVDFVGKTGDSLFGQISGKTSIVQMKGRFNRITLIVTCVRITRNTLRTEMISMNAGTIC